MAHNDFPLHHGSIALSFVGTIGDRGSEPLERIASPRAFAEWLRAAGLVDHLASPSAKSHTDALALRESIGRTARALVANRRPPRIDIATINDAARKWASRPLLDPKSLRIVERQADPIKAALGRIAADAIDLFGNAERRALLRSCALEACGSVFLTPAGRRERRWCSMERCGNRAKVAAFRARAASNP